MEMLENKYGPARIAQYKLLNEKVKAQAEAYDQAVINGELNVIYHFGSDVMNENDLTITEQGIAMSKFENQLSFSQENPFAEYCK